MEIADSPVKIFVVLTAIIVVWLILWRLIVWLWELLDSGHDASDQTEEIELMESENRYLEASTPVRKEWEEKGISFLEWLDYSDPRTTQSEAQLPPSSYYDQFKSSRPPGVTTQNRESDDGRLESTTSKSVSGGVIQPVPVAAPTSNPRKQSTSPLVAKFLNEGIHLFHFTDATNLESIKEVGLLSRRDLATRPIPVNYLSDDLSRSLDDQRGLSDFVHLAFHPEHMMLKAVQYQSRTSNSIVVLGVRLSVLDRPGCCFTRTLANANGAVRIPITEISDSDLRQLASVSYESRKWQLLVPGSIPMSLMRVHAIHESLTPIWQ